MSIRDLVYGAIIADSAMNVLGINESTTYPNYAPDSPAADQQRWLVIRWGGNETRVAPGMPARPGSFTLWVYDRERDFGAIDSILSRARALADTLVGQQFTGGAVIDVVPQDASEDLYDSIYEAVARNQAFRVVASGV